MPYLIDQIEICLMLAHFYGHVEDSFILGHKMDPSLLTLIEGIEGAALRLLDIKELPFS